MKILQLIIITGISLLLIGVASAQQACPTGYMMHGSSCYKFVHQHFSWPESVTFCKALGANLVQIGSAEEHNFLIQQAKTLESSDATFDTKEYWIDLSDGLVEGEWTWTRGYPLKPTYIKWGPSQPGDNPTSPEDCTGLWKEGGYLFGDWPCSTKLHSICEIEMG